MLQDYVYQEITTIQALFFYFLFFLSNYLTKNNYFVLSVFLTERRRSSAIFTHKKETTPDYTQPAYLFSWIRTV
jgi:hypothetical protein